MPLESCKLRDAHMHLCLSPGSHSMGFGGLQQGKAHVAGRHGCTCRHVPVRGGLGRGRLFSAWFGGFEGHEAESGKGAPGNHNFCPWVCRVAGEIKSEGVLPTLHTRKEPVNSAYHDSGDRDLLRTRGWFGERWNHPISFLWQRSPQLCPPCPGQAGGKHTGGKEEEEGRAT